MSRVSTADVAIIGGGVIGAVCARAAAERGLHTVVFEPGPNPAAASAYAPRSSHRIARSDSATHSPERAPRDPIGTSTTPAASPTARAARARAALSAPRAARVISAITTPASTASAGKR